MNVPISIDAPILFAVVIGFAIGIGVSILDSALDAVIRKVWWGWRIAVRNIAMQAVIFALFFGGCAFILGLFDPYVSLEAFYKPSDVVFVPIVIAFFNILIKTIVPEEGKNTTIEK